MKTRTIYEAFDGKEFENAEACKAYEAEHVEARVVDLSIDDVRRALSREDVELSDAFEELGRRCSETRRAAGILRRKPKTAETGKPDETPAAEQDDETATDRVAA